MKPEPTLPQQAFATDAAGNPTDAALDAEDSWHDAILLWGRDGWNQVGRLCRWAVKVNKGPIAGLDCPPAPAH